MHPKKEGSGVKFQLEVIGEVHARLTFVFLLNVNFMPAPTSIRDYSRELIKIMSSGFHTKEIRNKEIYLENWIASASDVIRIQSK